MIETNQTPAGPVAHDTTIVKLLQPHGIYNAGEVVGFRTPVADLLIKKRVAQKVEQIKREEPKPPQGTKMTGSPVDKQQLPGVVKK